MHNEKAILFDNLEKAINFDYDIFISKQRNFVSFSRGQEALLEFLDLQNSVLLVSCN